MLFDYTVIANNAGLLLEGLARSLLITAIALAAGGALGLAVCAARLARRRALPRLARGYIGFFRTTPEMVLIFWVYFCLPPITGLLLSGLASGTIALALVTGAYLAEIFRAGIEAVPAGQVEAARALGLRARAIWITVLLPQAVRRMLPALLNYFTELLKNSTLLSGIGVAELAYQAYTLGARTYRYVELLTAVAVLFFVVIFGLSLYARYLDRALVHKTGR